MEKGNHQTRTSEISSRVGIAEGTLFNYFPRKEDILTTLYRQIKVEFYAAITPEMNEGEQIYGYLKRCWFDFVCWGLDHYNRAIFLMQMTDSPDLEHVRDEVEDKRLATLGFYQQGIDQGFLRPIPIGLAGMWYVEAMMTTIRYLRNSAKPRSREKELEIIDLAFSNYLFGIRL